MKNCTVFLRSDQTPPNPEEIKKDISSSDIADKIKGIKSLIKCLISDESFPPMIMHIIGTIIPVVSQSNQLRKVMLLYWEIIEKNQSPTDKSLKQQMFLACNSLRTDLLCHNEYLRGRTLRLISRIMHKGVIQPLSSAIVSNLDHKSSYVRRNAVVCLYQVYIHFGSDIIGDIDQEIQKLLTTETDLSTKRNAFLLLHKTNPKKAMKYIETQVNNQAIEEIGDILQLAILKVFKNKCKQDPTQKGKLLKMIKDFSIKAKQSVSLECAITSTAISNSATTVKNSLYAYVGILARTNELNVKKIILDKLAAICKNASYLDDDLVEDLLKGLTTPSLEIKQKLLQIITSGVTLKTSLTVLKQLQKQIKGCTQTQYFEQIVKAVECIGLKYKPTHKQVLEFITEYLFKMPLFTYSSAFNIINTIKQMLLIAQPQDEKLIKNSILTNFEFISSSHLLRSILNLIGKTMNEKEQISKSIVLLNKSVGTLPIIADKKQSISTQQQNTSKPEEKKVFKTVILEDGTYATQLVTIKSINNQEQSKQTQFINHFRNFLANDSIIGITYARNIGKLLQKISRSDNFNKYACSILMILCSLLRNYQKNIQSVDQACIDQITTLIRKITKPQSFINEQMTMAEESEIQVIKYERHTNVQMIEKNPEDLIVFRQIKKQEDQMNDLEFQEEQINDFADTQQEKTDYISRLKSLVQLTGYFDPIYAQSFIKINKYDIFFEVMMMNNSKNNLFNVQIQFSSAIEILILEKAQCVNLLPNQVVNLRCQIRFINGEFGPIYGFISYDNQAGQEQPYLITEAIKLNYMQFISPQQISEVQFKTLWQKASTQVNHQLHIKDSKITFKQIIKKIEKKLHLLSVVGYQQDEQEEYFLNMHFYGKSKLGQSVLLNAGFFKGETISINMTIKSKDKAVCDIIEKQLLKVTFEEDQQ